MITQKLIDPTNIPTDVYQEVKKLFHKFWDGLPVRRLGVALSDLSERQYINYLCSKRVGRKREKSAE
ncbi:hypothetical protein [Paenibacillus alvei]|uniref:DinB/UmuC family translesion DNA polymerase n=1 Tax=Paenibacillus alvei TaxID=44250 RepID=UPI0026A0F75C